MSTVPDILSHMGGVPVGMEILQPADVKWVYSSTTAEPYKHLFSTVSDRTKLYSTLLAAHTASTSGRNEVIFITPEEHAETAASSSTAAVTFSKSNIHVIGMGNYLPGYNACAINDDGSTGTGHYNPLLSVTGNYNSFRNLRFSVGNATNTNLNSLKVLGNGNLFENCFFDGPLSTTLADLETYDLFKVAGVGNVFRNCVFGTMWKTRSVANNLLKFDAESSSYQKARHTVFENCIFQSNVDNTAVTHIDVNSDGYSPYGPQYFRSCTLFFRWSDLANTVTKAIEWGAGGVVGMLYFDANCCVWGATDITSGTTGRTGIVWGHGGGTITTTTLGLANVTA